MTFEGMNMSEEQRRKIGLHIMFKRKQLGKSQDGLAKALKVSRISFNRMELGKVRLSLENAVRIARLLKFDVADYCQFVGE